MKRLLALIIILIMMVPAAFAEEEEELEEQQELAVLYVMTKVLNGRIRPGKRHSAILSFDMWTPLQPTGRVSRDQMWVEIRSTEGDLVWCNVEYLTERREIIHVYTLWDSVKIRDKRGTGRVTGKAKKNQILEITQVVMGYGKCDMGWVDLSYFIEDCE